jgi:hypothetical protein
MANAAQGGAVLALGVGGARIGVIAAHCVKC